MANAKKCDRCGSFYDKNLKYSVRGMQIREEEFVSGFEYTTTGGSFKARVDLCDGCLTELELFLADGKDQERRKKMILAIKFICLVFAIVYGYSNTAKVFRGQSVTDMQMFLMGIGIAGFVFLQWVV